ncbi:hypothetical protein Tco_0424790 [Tanacetum coccineum]
MCYDGIFYNLDKHQFILSRDVKFFESDFPFKIKIADDTDAIFEEIEFQDLNQLNFFDNGYPETPNDDERVEIKHASDGSFFPHLGSNDELANEFFNSINEDSSLYSNDNIFSKPFIEASKFTHSTDDMNAKMEALLRNDTWEITDLLKDRKAIGNK